MRIILDVTPLDTGHRGRGVGTYVRGLVQALPALETAHLWLLITHDPARWRGFPDCFRPIRLPYLPLGRLTALVTHQLLLPLLLQRLPADVVHFPGLSAHLSVTGVSWRVPHPFVVTVHDFTPMYVPELMHGKRVNHWWYARQRAWARRAVRLICVSQATQRDAMRILAVPSSRCPVIYEGVDRALFHPGDGRKAEPPFILFVGGDLPNKNQETVLAAFARLCAMTRLPHRLVVVGPGTPDPPLSAPWAIPPERVVRVGQLAARELAEYYRRADLFVFPSRHEGFGLPVLEAMASGTPVITSTAASLPEVAGDAAWLVDPEDAEGLFEAMRRLLTDRARWRRLREAGLARVERFTWAETARRTIAVYEEALAER